MPFRYSERTHNMNRAVLYTSIMPILLIAVSSNLDNIGVGTSYGVRKINIPIASNLLIAAVTATGTFLSVILGKSVYLFISKGMAGLLGGGIIVLAGLWVVFQERFMHRLRESWQAEPLVKTGFRHIVQILDNPIVADRDFSGHIDRKEALALAFALTINNIPNGVGAGMLGLNLYAMTVTVFVVSIITIWLGIYLGKLGVRWMGRATGVLGGVLLICVGLYEIFL
jgi:putative sporulation protein YtaF